MRVPASQRPSHGNGRWEIVGSALDSWARTFPLCLILLVMTAAPVAATAVAELIRHMLVCEG